MAAETTAKGYRGRRVPAKPRFADFETLVRQITLPWAADAAARAARHCLDRIALTKKVRLVGVRLSGLERRRPAPALTVPGAPLSSRRPLIWVKPARRCEA